MNYETQEKIQPYPISFENLRRTDINHLRFAVIRYIQLRVFEIFIEYNVHIIQLKRAS